MSSTAVSVMSIWPGSVRKTTRLPFDIEPAVPGLATLPLLLARLIVTPAPKSLPVPGRLMSW